jgi:hypothetical protein
MSTYAESTVELYLSSTQHIACIVSSLIAHICPETCTHAAQALKPGQANKKMYRHHIVGRYTMRKKLQTKIQKEVTHLLQLLDHIYSGLTSASYSITF